MSEILLDRRDFPAGAGTLIRGAEETVQNVVESLATPYGSLPWGRPPVVPREQTAGSHLWSMLNDLIEPSMVIAEIRRVMLTLRGIVKSSIRVTYDDAAQQYRATFVPLEDRRVVALDLAETALTQLPSRPFTGSLLQVGDGRFLLTAEGRGLRLS